jgi:hypothetical protein
VITFFDINVELFQLTLNRLEQRRQINSAFQLLDCLGKTSLLNFNRIMTKRIHQRPIAIKISKNTQSDVSTGSVRSIMSFANPAAMTKNNTPFTIGKPMLFFLGGLNDIDKSLDVSPIVTPPPNALCPPPLIPPTDSDNPVETPAWYASETRCVLSLPQSGQLHLMDILDAPSIRVALDLCFRS